MRLTILVQLADTLKKVSRFCASRALSKKDFVRWLWQTMYDQQQKYKALKAQSMDPNQGPAKLMATKNGVSAGTGEMQIETVSAGSINSSPMSK